MKRKTVYLNDTLIGAASTWHDVATLVGKVLGRHVSVREIFNLGSEGPDGFYVKTRR
jgi:hypothetical protein